MSAEAMWTVLKQVRRVRYLFRNPVLKKALPVVLNDQKLLELLINMLPIEDNTAAQLANVLQSIAREKNCSIIALLDDGTDESVLGTIERLIESFTVGVENEETKSAK